MIFPLLKFWLYTPFGFLCAIVWNIHELLGRPLKNPEWWFGKTCSCKGKQIKGGTNGNEK